MVGGIKNVIHVYYIFFYRRVWEIGKSSFIASETSRRVLLFHLKVNVYQIKKNWLFLWFYCPTGNNTIIEQWN